MVGNDEPGACTRVDFASRNRKKRPVLELVKILGPLPLYLHKPR